MDGVDGGCRIGAHTLGGTLWRTGAGGEARGDGREGEHEVRPYRRSVRWRRGRLRHIGEDREFGRETREYCATDMANTTNYMRQIVVCPFFGGLFGRRVLS